MGQSVKILLMGRAYKSFLKRTAPDASLSFSGFCESDGNFLPFFFFQTLQLLMIPLIMSVLYVWAQLNREMIVSFWLGTRFKVCQTGYWKDFCLEDAHDGGGKI